VVSPPARMANGIGSATVLILENFAKGFGFQI